MGSERSAHRQMRHEATWAITVATAAPVMPPVEHEHKDEIEHNVDGGGDDHGEQRRAAVAHGAQDGGKHVVSHGDEAAAENHAQVGKRAGQDILRRAEQQEHRLHEELHDHGERHAADARQQNGAGDGAVEAVPVFRAEALGDLDGKALREALDEADDEPVEPVGRAERCERIHAHGLSPPRWVSTIV